MSIESQAPPPPPLGALSKRPPDDQPPARLLPQDVVVEQILTRVPAAAAVRFRAVCRAWCDALTSDYFAEAYRVARAGAQPPEIVFFAPVPAATRSNTTAFYTCKLNLTAAEKKWAGEKAASARELVTVGNLCAKELVLSGTRPCHGLTLLSNFGLSVYHVCNLSTGDVVSLPPCPPANPGEKGVAIRTGPGFSVLSCTGLGFDSAAREHKVVRLYEDREKQPRCEVYALRSGGWRPCAGTVPPLATKCLDGRPPVFVGGCFYWDTFTKGSVFNMQASKFRTPEPILSLTVGTEEFGWVAAPVRYAECLAELDGSLCAVVEGRSDIDEECYELWTRSADCGPAPPSWSLRCRIMLESLPQPIRSGMWHGRGMIPLASSSGGKILLATNRHEVYAYDPESNSAERVFSMQEFLDDDPVAGVPINIALHEDSVVGVRRRPVASDDGGQLKVKRGRSTFARREGSPVLPGKRCRR